MTEQEITALGPAFASYLRRFRGSFGQDRTAAHFDTYCRGLLTDLPRKTVEPIALEAGTAVRTLQEFLVTARWNHDQARDTLQQNLAGVLDPQEGARGKFDHIQLGQRVAAIARIEDSQRVGCGLERDLAALRVLGAVI